MSLLSVSDLATIDRFVQTRRDRADLAGGLPGLFNGRRVGRGGRHARGRLAHPALVRSYLMMRPCLPVRSRSRV